MLQKIFNTITFVLRCDKAYDVKKKDCAGKFLYTICSSVDHQIAGIELTINRNKGN